MRKIFEYLSNEKKTEAVEMLKKDLKKLDEEIAQNKNAYSEFIMEILYSTRDKWSLEISELETEIKNTK
ncbi:hypothetical protein [Lysinibacillus agricola]|uniref:hypothetical protein n=1 Tax=Lysinibacillus agricola TaxID=2590012 RepID=UPI003C1F28B0